MHERPQGGKDEVAGMVFLVAGIDADDRKLVWGKYSPVGDLTAVRWDRTRDLPAHATGALN